MNSDLMNFVGQKLTESKNDLMVGGIRDARGFMETAERISKSTNNLYFSLGNQCFEPIGALYEAFAERPGLNDVKNVAAVDIVDINIMATQQSVMGYLSAERGMDKPVDTCYYQLLQAMNDAGGFASGDTVLHPFKPLSPKVNLGSYIASGIVDENSGTVPSGQWKDFTYDGFIEFNSKNPISKGGVTLSHKTGDVVDVIGQDKDADGKIYFDAIDGIERAVIDYETGKLYYKGTALNDWTAVAVVSRTGEKTGVSTLRVKPVTSTITLTAKPNRIILENSFEDNAYLNKQTYNVAAIGVQMDFGKRAVNQLLQLFTYYLDLTSVTKTAEVMLEKEAAIPDLDLTAYSIATSEASTKNDIINNSMLQLIKKLQQQSGKGPSCYLVDTEGAVVLGNNQMYFTQNANFDQALDGMIGTYRGYPVIRHHALDGIVDGDASSSDRFAFIGALHKSPDGQIAPTMYGEYLPPYSIVPALNYDNPAQFSQALLSSSTTEKLVDTVCCWFRVRVAK